MSKLISFFEDSNKGGGLSSTRLLQVSIVFAYILWGTIIVCKTDAIPVFPETLVWLMSILYGLNKTNFKIGKKSE